jgi:hypothetical protein
VVTASAERGLEWYDEGIFFGVHEAYSMSFFTLLRVREWLLIVGEIKSLRAQGVCFTLILGLYLAMEPRIRGIIWGTLGNILHGLFEH